MAGISHKVPKYSIKSMRNCGGNATAVEPSLGRKLLILLGRPQFRIPTVQTRLGSNPHISIVTGLGHRQPIGFSPMRSPSSQSAAMLLPPVARLHSRNPTFPDFRGEHRPEPVPPEPHRFMADVDAPFMQQILHIAERQWKTDVHHHRQPNDLGRGLEVAQRAAFYNALTLCGRPARLKPFRSDSAVKRSELMAESALRHAGFFHGARNRTLSDCSLEGAQ